MVRRLKAGPCRATGGGAQPSRHGGGGDSAGSVPVALGLDRWNVRQEPIQQAHAAGTGSDGPAFSELSSGGPAKIVRSRDTGGMSHVQRLDSFVYDHLRTRFVGPCLLQACLSRAAKGHLELGELQSAIAVDSRCEK